MKNLLNFFRTKRRMDASTLASRAEISTGTVYGLEKDGMDSVRRDTMLALALALDLPPGAFFQEDRRREDVWHLTADRRHWWGRVNGCVGNVFPVPNEEVLWAFWEGNIHMAVVKVDPSPLLINQVVTETHDGHEAFYVLSGAACFLCGDPNGNFVLPHEKMALVCTVRPFFSGDKIYVDGRVPHAFFTPTPELWHELGVDQPDGREQSKLLKISDGAPRAAHGCVLDEL